MNDVEACILTWCKSHGGSGSGFDWIEYLDRDLQTKYLVTFGEGWRECPYKTQGMIYKWLNEWYSGRI